MIKCGRCEEGMQEVACIIKQQLDCAKTAAAIEAVLEKL